MPYYLFKITPGPTDLTKQLDLQQEFESFQEAKKTAREMRAELGADSNLIVKVMFAGSVLEAEEKLQEHREAPILAEWEK